MGHLYRLVQVLDAALFILEHPAHGRHLWLAVRLQRHHDCALCHRTLAPNTRAYRPLTTAGNRGHRLCRSCVEDPCIRYLHEHSRFTERPLEATLTRSSA